MILYLYCLARKEGRMPSSASQLGKTEFPMQALLAKKCLLKRLFQKVFCNVHIVFHKINRTFLLILYFMVKSPELCDSMSLFSVFIAVQFYACLGYSHAHPFPSI